jgi:hypothetical protein
MKRLNAAGGVACALALAVGWALQPAAAQSKGSEPKHLVNKETGAVCEMNNLYIDLLVIEAQKTNQRIFIISRLGAGEQSKLGWRRLRKAHFFLTSGKEVPPGRIVIAAGESMGKQKGRLEFYLGGELFLLSEAEKGKDVCLNCCDSPY